MELTSHIALRRTATVASTIAGAMIILLMLLTIVDISLRTAGKAGVFGGIEFSEVMLVIAVFAGMMTAELTGAHVKTPILTARLKTIAARSVQILGALIAVVLLAWMVVVSSIAAWQSFQVGEVHLGLARIPVWPAKAFVPIGMLGMLLVLLFSIFQHLLIIRETMLSKRSDLNEPTVEESSE